MAEDGSEYWSARDLAKILGYASNYRNFKPAIEKAKEACEQSGHAVADHFADVRNMIEVGKGARKNHKHDRYAIFASTKKIDASNTEASIH